MQETHETRLLAFLRYRDDVKREMRRLEKKAVRSEDAQADVAIRREALREFLVAAKPEDGVESYLLMQADGGAQGGDRTRLEHLRGLLSIIENHINELRKYAPDVTEPDGDESLDDATTKQLALIAVERWAPDQDIRQIAEGVRESYLAAKKAISEMNPDGVLYITVI